MSKTTDIKFSNIKKKAKQVYETEQYTLDDGSTITFYPSFPPLLTKKMLSECQSILATLDEGIEMSEEDYHSYILFMCIKHFTHLKSQLKADTFVGQINEMNSIIDAGLFDLIIDEVFLPSEINSIFDQLAKLGGKFMYMEKMTQKMHEEFGKLELKNKEVFENLNLIKSESVE